LTITVRENAWPRDREAVGFDAQSFHQLHVTFVQVVMIVGDVAVGVVNRAAWSV
jgi:hypothetical protein